MKKRIFKEKICSLILAAAMIITPFPTICLEVHAEEVPNCTSFATTKQLQAFNTDDSDGSINPAKVCFGKDNHEWWIAGSQSNGSLALFAASPLATRQEFEPDSENNKQYSTDWGCKYTGEEPSEVYPNHYGASPLRTTLKELETSFFSTDEQDMMNNTTIYTNDTKNSSAYSTTDKLYLAYGVDDTSEKNYITVGANTLGNLKSGLHIDDAYWGNGEFWLRTPFIDSGDISFMVDSTNLADIEVGVSRSMVHGEVNLMPAFELNLSSVLFASAARAAHAGNEESGKISDGTAMSLRQKGDGKAIGTLKYDEIAGIITARKDENAAETVSLVVQGNDGTRDWYYSVPVGETTVFTKKQIQDACSISTEIDLAKCKIWLETTIDNVIYAKMAEKQITITAAEQSVIWGGNGIDRSESAYMISGSGLNNGDRISEISLTPSGAELTDNGTITIDSVKIVNDDGEDVTGNYDITFVRGRLKVVHNTTLAPDRIEASKIKTTYTAGETLNVDDLTVTAYYADGYSGTVTGFVTNVADIDMSTAGDKILTVSYMENGGTKTEDITIKVSAPAHTHEFGTEWKNDSKNHWHECACGEKLDSAAHIEDGGSVTKEPTETEVGVRSYKCSVCGYVMRTEEIKELPPLSTGAPEESKKPASTGTPDETKKPTSTGTPDETKKPTSTGTPVETKKPTSTKKPQETVTAEEMKKNSEKLDSGLSVNWKGNTISLKWPKIAGTEGYDIFAGSGKNLNKKYLEKTVKKGKTSISLTKIEGKKISEKKVYSVRIKTWKHVGGKKVYIGSSKTYHIVGKTNKKFTNAKKLKLPKKKYALKKGKSLHIKVTIVKQVKKKKLLPKSYGPALQYWSGNKKIATVTSNGKIQAKKKGICYIYVTALNGLRTKIKITVK